MLKKTKAIGTVKKSLGRWWKLDNEGKEMSSRGNDEGENEGRRTGKG